MLSQFPEERRTEPTLLWSILGLVLLSGALMAVALFFLRSEVIQSAEQNTHAFAANAEIETTRTLQAVDQTLQLIVNRLPPPPTDMGDARMAALRGVMRSYLETRPYIRALFVLDERGRSIADAISTDSRPLDRGLDLSSRPYFVHYRDARPDAFTVHGPIVGYLSRDKLVPATRPWLDSDGEFLGVVGALIDPASFSWSWTSEGKAVDAAIMLLRRDGTLLFRSPMDQDLIGKSYPIREVFQSPADGVLTGTIRNANPINGSEQILTYRSLNAFSDLVIVFQQSLDSVLADWRRYAYVAVGGWLFFVIAFSGLGFWLVMEGRRRSRAEALAVLSLDRLSAVMDHTVDGLIVIDQYGTVLSFNIPAEKIFGYAADEVIGRNVSMLMPEPYHSAHDGYLDAYLKTGVAQIIGIGREVEGRRKDGSVFAMDLAVGEIPSSTGHRQFVGTTRDISQRIALESLYRQSQKMEAVGQLTGGIAHDFNNLLAVMMGNIEMARELDPSPQMAPLLKSAERASERGAELTRRLLAFSRRQTLQPRRVDINKLLLDFIALLRRTLGENIAVETRLFNGALHVNVDPGQLENAILNLAVNARDAMPDGGVLTLSTGSTVLDDDYADSHFEVTPGVYRVITVSDNGVGMTEQVRAKVFEPFFTTKGVGKGSGLGLSMVYGFVKQSNGHVSIYSEPGDGTTIRLYLPVSPDDVSEDSVAPILSAGAIGQGQTVLVVEDDEDVRKVVAAMVARLGFVPLLATDAYHAQEVLSRSVGIDLMITDVVMPLGMSGLDLAKSVQATKPDLPVIFMSGYSDDVAALAGVVQSGRQIITKPFSRAQLAQAIRLALGGDDETGKPPP